MADSAQLSAATLERVLMARALDAQNRGIINPLGTLIVELQNQGAIQAIATPNEAVPYRFSSRDREALVAAREEIAETIAALPNARAPRDVERIVSRFKTGDVREAFYANDLTYVPPLDNNRPMIIGLTPEGLANGMQAVTEAVRTTRLGDDNLQYVAGKLPQGIDVVRREQTPHYVAYAATSAEIQPIRELIDRECQVQPQRREAIAQLIEQGYGLAVLGQTVPPASREETLRLLDSLKRAEFTALENAVRTDAREAHAAQVVSELLDGFDRVRGRIPRFKELDKQMDALEVQLEIARANEVNAENGEPLIPGPTTVNDVPPPQSTIINLNDNQRRAVLRELAAVNLAERALVEMTPADIMQRLSQTEAPQIDQSAGEIVARLERGEALSREELAEAFGPSVSFYLNQRGSVLSTLRDGVVVDRIVSLIERANDRDIRQLQRAIEGAELRSNIADQIAVQPELSQVLGFSGAATRAQAKEVLAALSDREVNTINKRLGIELARERLGSGEEQRYTNKRSSIDRFFGTYDNIESAQTRAEKMLRDAEAVRVDRQMPGTEHPLQQEVNRAFRDVEATATRQERAAALDRARMLADLGRAARGDLHRAEETFRVDDRLKSGQVVVVGSHNIMIAQGNVVRVVRHDAGNVIAFDGLAVTGLISDDRALLEKAAPTVTITDLGDGRNLIDVPGRDVLLENIRENLPEALSPRQAAELQYATAMTNLINTARLAHDAIMRAERAAEPRLQREILPPELRRIDTIGTLPSVNRDMEVLTPAEHGERGTFRGPIVGKLPHIVAQLDMRDGHRWLVLHDRASTPGIEDAELGQAVDVKYGIANSGPAEVTLRDERAFDPVALGLIRDPLSELSYGPHIDALVLQAARDYERTYGTQLETLKLPEGERSAYSFDVFARVGNDVLLATENGYYVGIDARRLPAGAAVGDRIDAIVHSVENPLPHSDTEQALRGDRDFALTMETTRMIKSGANELRQSANERLRDREIDQALNAFALQEMCKRFNVDKMVPIDLSADETTLKQMVPAFVTQSDIYLAHKDGGVGSYLRFPAFSSLKDPRSTANVQDLMAKIENGERVPRNLVSEAANALLAADEQSQRASVRYQRFPSEPNELAKRAMSLASVDVIVKHGVIKEIVPGEDLVRTNEPTLAIAEHTVPFVPVMVAQPLRAGDVEKPRNYGAEVVRVDERFTSVAINTDKKGELYLTALENGTELRSSVPLQVGDKVVLKASPTLLNDSLDVTALTRDGKTRGIELVEPTIEAELDGPDAGLQ